MNEKEIEAKIKEMKEVTIVLNNVQQASKIGRFNFTDKEKMALDFAVNLLDANLAEFSEEK